MDNFMTVGITIDEFYNVYTLNIFADASIIGKSGNYTGCYGVAAVCMDNIIDVEYKLVSNTTNNDSELKGIRSATTMANKFKYNFKRINIFSDSQISIFGIRDYYPKWKYNPKDGNLYGVGKTPIKNQSLFIEINEMIKNIRLTSPVILNLYHQSGHVDNKYDNIVDASRVFAKSNNIVGNIDLNFIRYISTYNNFVDSNSRSYLRRADRRINYSDPITFIPNER